MNLGNSILIDIEKTSFPSMLIWYRYCAVRCDPKRKSMIREQIKWLVLQLESVLELLKD